MNTARNISVKSKSNQPTYDCPKISFVGRHFSPIFIGALSFLLTGLLLFFDKKPESMQNFTDFFELLLRGRGDLFKNLNPEILAAAAKKVKAQAFLAF